MGKHATPCQKVAFLVHSEYIKCAEAAQKAGIPFSTAKVIKKRNRELCVKHAEEGLPPPSYEEQVTRKKGSGAEPKLSEADMERLLEACTIDKKAKRKLWIQVACE